MSEPKETLRLSKLMSERGLCSRREADEFIAQGLVFVNGERVQELGFKVTRDVHVELAGKAQAKQDSLVTVILNKPIGYVSAQPEADYEPAVKLLTLANFGGDPKRPPQKAPADLGNLAVAGRLDIDSQGLLIFTQDGRIAKKLIGENSVVEKEYLVRVQGQLINEDQLRFVLTEGKKRQVRRMCEAVGLVVKGLKRVRVGKLMLGHLPEGQWRYLDSREEI
jgi:23S rRNA pseudouridine2604 synthase